MTVTKDDAQTVVDLGQLVLCLGRVERITYHEDGVRPETDTDHTVMLGIVATSFAARFLPRLDLGRVAQFALVHDLVEAYAGDTPTLRITQDQVEAKHLREKQAQEQIQNEFLALPWVSYTIDAYEAQAEPEARYVKAMDKLVPKVTHILNQGAALKKQGVEFMELATRYAAQLKDLERYAGDFPPLFELRFRLLNFLFDTVFSEVKT